jgi:hypothetical protein
VGRAPVLHDAALHRATRVSKSKVIAAYPRRRPAALARGLLARHSRLTSAQRCHLHSGAVRRSMKATTSSISSGMSSARRLNSWDIGSSSIPIALRVRKAAQRAPPQPLSESGLSLESVWLCEQNFRGPRQRPPYHLKRGKETTGRRLAQ